MKAHFTQQEQSISQVEDQVIQELDLLQNDEISLVDLQSNDPELLIYMTQTVDQLYTKSVNYKPEIDLSKVCTHFTCRDTLFDKLKAYMHESCTL